MKGAAGRWMFASSHMRGGSTVVYLMCYQNRIRFGAKTPGFAALPRTCIHSTRLSHNSFCTETCVNTSSSLR